MMGLIALLDGCWTPAMREQCVRALAAKANAGDMDAIKLLFNYAYGRPKEVKEHAGELRVDVRYVSRSVGSEDA